MVIFEYGIIELVNEDGLVSKRFKRNSQKVHHKSKRIESFWI